MKLSERFIPEGIKINSESTDKRELIIELVETLVQAHDLEKHHDNILESVLSREEKMSTGIGCGLAVPHAKVGCIDSMYMVASTCSGGVDFEAIDKEPVYLMILLISPENTIGPHLRALSSVSRIMADSKVRTDLVAAQTSEEFIQVLVDAEERFG